MRQNYILLVVLVALLSIGPATSVASEVPFLYAADNYNFALEEETKGDGDSSTEVTAHIVAEYPQYIFSIIDLDSSSHGHERKCRLVSYPLLPQAPPAKFRYV